MLPAPSYIPAQGTEIDTRQPRSKLAAAVSDRSYRGPCAIAECLKSGLARIPGCGAGHAISQWHATATAGGRYRVHDHRPGRMRALRTRLAQGRERYCDGERQLEAGSATRGQR
jgi:hypothetical protein